MKKNSDTASGATTQRLELSQSIEFCRSNDTLIALKLDRMGRSIPHFIKTIRNLESREIGFHLLTEKTDTASVGGRWVFYLFGALPEFERDLIREWVQAGLISARARGRKGALPPVSEETK